jgi:hypothetical protein
VVLDVNGGKGEEEEPRAEDPELLLGLDSHRG